MSESRGPGTKRSKPVLEDDIVSDVASSARGSDLTSSDARWAEVCDAAGLFRALEVSFEAGFFRILGLPMALQWKCFVAEKDN